MGGRLTTHVLDIAQGRPAVGMVIELWRLGQQGETRALLKTVMTNADGRISTPLLEDNELTIGVYELVFAVGAYFDDQHIGQTELSFLDRVPIRFGIADADAHYHVPLLTSPWSYTTYRGS